MMIGIEYKIIACKDKIVEFSSASNVSYWKGK